MVHYSYIILYYDYIIYSFVTLNASHMMFLIVSLDLYTLLHAIFVRGNLVPFFKFPEEV